MTAPYREDRGFDPMTNWEKNAITSDMEVTKEVNVRQSKVECSWCDKKWLVIIDKHTEATGIMMCTNCGKFFRWTVHFEQDVACTRRVIPRPRTLDSVVRGYLREGALDYG